MTTFDTYESSAAASRPVELISFAIGSTTYRYTTGPLALDLGGYTYRPEGITRSAVVLGATAHDQTLEVVVPATNAFAALYIDIVPPEQATCTVLRLQRPEVPTFNTTSLMFKGRVKAVKFLKDGSTASIGVQSLEASLNKQMGAYTYQGPCNHQLYSARCGADPVEHTHTGTVTTVSGATITVTGLNSSGIMMTGGHVKPTTAADFRMVVSQAGDVLTLLLPFHSSPLGIDVDCVAGCDHDVNGDCGDVFDNVLRFGGFGFMPLKNPFNGI